jgi:glycine cleavage system H lipoate-binding protein
MSRATNISASIENVTGKVWKPCWWMQAGVVDYKLCDREYDCEHCAFDEVLQGKVARLNAGSATLLFESPSDQQSTAIKRSDAAPQSVRGCEVLDGLFYHRGHTWARIEEAGTVRTGIDDFGQRVLGRAYSVSFPLLGAAVQRGEECWRFTHQAGVVALVSPVSGKIREINSSLFQRPSLINRDPHGLGWSMLIEPADLRGCLKDLLFGRRVRAWLEREIEKLYRTLSEVISGQRQGIGLTMNDGGLLESDFMSGLTAAQMRRVISAFFPPPSLEGTERNNSNFQLTVRR